MKKETTQNCCGCGGCGKRSKIIVALLILVALIAGIFWYLGTNSEINLLKFKDKGTPTTQMNQKTTGQDGESFVGGDVDQ